MHPSRRGLLERARQSGIAARIDGETWGWARPAAIRAHGADAVSWLQSQTTNDVEALAVGGGHLGARVTRTGHLQAVFSVHRLPDTDGGEQDLLLLVPSEDVERVLGEFDAFLFADRVTLEIALGEASWAAVVGPSTGAVVDAVAPGLAVDGVVAVDGGWVLRRGWTGDDGLLVAGDDALVQRVLDAAAAAGVQVVSGAELSDAVEALRVEAGLVRPAVDLAKKRLLPETGLEQYAVSYTKGCYIGQEVIARVRTYGSVPRALRALVLDGDALEGLPEPGADVLTDDGTRIGHAASAAWSVVEGAPVLLAYLGRDHRTPGATHTLRTSTGLRQARVALLPLHHVADRSDRVDQLYDRGVRAFAEGDEAQALQLLEEALRLDPEFGDAYEAIGVILGRGGRFHEAIDFFRRLEEVVPGEPLVNTNLSLYYMKLGDKETAENQAAIAARKGMARSSGEADRTAAELAKEQAEAALADAQRKERMFRQVMDFDPEDPIALFGLGKALSVQQRWDEAAEVLGRAVAADGKNSAAYLAWGKALEHAGDVAQAVVAYRNGMEVASRRGDLMPLKEMQSRLLLLGDS